MLFLKKNDYIKNPVVMPLVYYKAFFCASLFSLVLLPFLVILIPDGKDLYSSALSDMVFRLKKSIQALEFSAFESRINLVFFWGWVNFIIGLFFLFYSVFFGEGFLWFLLLL